MSAQDTTTDGGSSTSAATRTPLSSNNFDGTPTRGRSTVRKHTFFRPAGPVDPESDLRSETRQPAPILSFLSPSLADDEDAVTSESSLSAAEEEEDGVPTVVVPEIIPRGFASHRQNTPAGESTTPKYRPVPPITIHDMEHAEKPTVLSVQRLNHGNDEASSHPGEKERSSTDPRSPFRAPKEKLARTRMKAWWRTTSEVSMVEMEQIEMTKPPSSPSPVVEKNFSDYLYQRPAVASLISQRHPHSRFSPPSSPKMGGSDATFVIPSSRRTRKGAQLSMFEGVYVPCVASVLGTILFLRVPWIVGHAGIWSTVGVVALSYVCALLTWLSLCAVVTNGIIPAGGTYYLISRALGPQVGGAVGIMYFLGILLQGALHSIGAAEIIAHSVDVDMDAVGLRMIAAVILVFLMAGVVYTGIRRVSILEMILLGSVFLSLLFVYLGTFLAPGFQDDPSITGLKQSTFSANRDADYGGSVSFGIVLSIFFPSVTGMLAGANRSGDLRDAQRGIPKGTGLALLTTIVVSTTTVFLVGSSVDREELKDDRFILTSLGWPNVAVLVLGLTLAAFAEGLQALTIGPRLLQAIAKDNIAPFLRPLSRSHGPEPRRALLLCFLVTLGIGLTKEFDLVAKLISLFLLISYAFINLACFVLTILRAPNFRPRWRFYHWSTALIGFLICTVVLFVISWWLAIVCIVVAGVLYKYIEYRGDETDWGDGLRGLRLQQALDSLLTLENQGRGGIRHTKNWRPQILALVKLNLDGTPTHPELLSFLHQLKKGRGLTVVAAIIEGDYVQKAEEAERERSVLEGRMKAEQIRGFATVMVAPTYRDGKNYIIQAIGLGELRPNTIVLGWPFQWRGDSHIAESFVSTFEQCRTSERAVLVCKGLRNFPKSHERMDGNLDLWWIVHDGGLELLIAFLLMKHKVWRKCRLRIFTVASILDDSDRLRSDLIAHLYNLRIEGDVSVVQMEDQCIAPYSYEHTLLAEQRQKMLGELLKHRRHDSRWERESGRHTPSRRRSPSPRRRLGSFFFDSVQEDIDTVVDRARSRSPSASPLHSRAGSVSPSRRVFDASPQILSIPSVPGKLGVEMCMGPARGDSTESTITSQSETIEDRMRENLLRLGASFKLNQTIRKYSTDSALVLVNLPSPHGSQSPEDYMEYVDVLSENLSRLIMIHGSGKEVVTIYS